MIRWFSPPRLALLVLSLLSACAAAGAGQTSEDLSRTAASAFLQGRFAASQGALALSAADFQRAYQADPSNGTLHEQAFLAALLADRPEAVTLARGLPKNQAAQLVLVDDDARQGHWDNAIKRLQAIPQQGVTQVLVPLLLAWCQQGAGQTDAALATLRPLIQEQRTQALGTLHAAMIQDLAGRKSDADRSYATAAAAFGAPSLELARIFASWDARDGRQQEALGVIGGLGNQGEMGLAQAQLTRDVAKPVIRNATDGMAAAYRFVALAVRQQNNGSFSVLLLRLAIDANPDDTMARLAMSEIYAANRQPLLALAVLDPVAKSDPLYDAVQLRRALFMTALGNNDGALEIMRRLVDAYPALAEPAVAEGDILRSQKQYAEAVKAYNVAVARSKDPGPATWVLFFNRGIAYDRSGDWTKAEADLRHALQLSPNQPAVLNYLGYSLADQGRDLPEARQMIEKALAASPNDGAIVDSLGWVTLKQGDVGGAVRYLERAVELTPEDPTVNGHLGDAYLAAGRKLEAAFQWQRALDLKPEPDDAAKLREKLAKDEEAMRAATATDPKTVR
jgi:tetratricopeptide (TPR) repeat protein